jgi:chromate reductase
MPRAIRVAVLVGSLRKESFSRKIALTLKDLAGPALELDLVELGRLPLYSEDEDSSTPPPAWASFRQAVAGADALLFVTPEYNRSVPGCLKNAIDVGSRPYGKNVWAGKPGAVVSVSPGALGGFGANHHLRQSLVFLDVPVLAQPELYLGGIVHALDAEGRLTDRAIRTLLEKFVAAFTRWIAANPVPREVPHAA